MNFFIVLVICRAMSRFILVILLCKSTVLCNSAQPIRGKLCRREFSPYSVRRDFDSSAPPAQLCYLHHLLLSKSHETTMDRSPRRRDFRWRIIFKPIITEYTSGFQWNITKWCNRRHCGYRGDNASALNASLPCTTEIIDLFKLLHPRAAESGEIGVMSVGRSVDRPAGRLAEYRKMQRVSIRVT